VPTITAINQYSQDAAVYARVAHTFCIGLWAWHITLIELSNGMTHTEAKKSRSKNSCFRKLSGNRWTDRHDRSHYLVRKRGGTLTLCRKSAKSIYGVYVKDTRLLVITSTNVDSKRKCLGAFRIKASLRTFATFSNNFVDDTLICSPCYFSFSYSFNLGILFSSVLLYFWDPSITGL